MKYDSVVNSFIFAAYSALLAVAGLGLVSGFADEAGCAVLRLSDFCAWTRAENCQLAMVAVSANRTAPMVRSGMRAIRSEEHTSELQSRRDLVCRLLLEKKKKIFGNMSCKKDDIRIERNGKLDEANSFIGLLRAKLDDDNPWQKGLFKIQIDMMDMMLSI